MATIAEQSAGPALPRVAVSAGDLVRIAVVGFIALALLYVVWGLYLAGEPAFGAVVLAIAVGIVIVMVSATIWHIARGEMSSAGVTTLLLAMAIFVAYGRQRILPIPPRAARGARL